MSIVSSIEKMFSLLTTAAYSLSDLGARTYEIGYYKEFMEFEERVLGQEGLPGNHDIVFENVCFKYPGTEREILHGLSFVIKSGEKAALVGVNGAGKSTVIKLLCGLYAPDSGRITVGGRDISELSRDALKKALAVVFQDFGSYQLTLRENVAFGDLSKLDSDKELCRALALAGAGELAGKGLDIPLGRLEEGGADVSKGQWQKIAIARAFLTSAEFIVLDEPTASLDPIAESKLYETFSSVLQRRGCILISHRLASARLADRIIVMKEGCVVGDGSHEELLKGNAEYGRIWNEQAKWYAE